VDYIGFICGLVLAIVHTLVPFLTSNTLEGKLLFIFITLFATTAFQLIKVCLNNRKLQKQYDEKRQGLETLRQAHKNALKAKAAYESLSKDTLNLIGFGIIKKSNEESKVLSAAQAILYERIVVLQKEFDENE